MRHFLNLGLVGAVLGILCSGYGLAQDGVCVDMNELERAGIQTGVDYDIVKGLLEQRGWQLKPICINPSECVEATESCQAGLNAHCTGHYVRDGRLITVDYFRDTAKLNSLTCDFIPNPNE